nr:MAG TPA: hypothetical protein [Caudoviricetes sp.]
MRLIFKSVSFFISHSFFSETLLRHLVFLRHF